MNTFKKIITSSCLVVIGLSLGSCELLGPRPAAKLPLTPVTDDKESPQPDVVFKELQNKPSTPESIRPASELYPGTNRFAPGVAAQNRGVGAPRSRGARPTDAGSFSLNFDEADLGEVAKVILSDILGQNYVLSPKVAGKVTLQTTEPLTKAELLPTLEMVLRMNNAALVKDGRIYHIEPTAEALYSSHISGDGTGYQTRVIPIRNVAVQDIVDIIKPMLQEKTIISVDGVRNILVASGTADEMSKVIEMVNTFDIDVLKGRSFGLFPLAHVDPETIIEELESLIYQKSGKDNKSAFFQFIPIERLNAILAVTHQSHYLGEIENWISRLDRANTAAGGGVNVYKVQHADAEELAGTLNEIFTGTAKKDKSAKVAPGQKAASMTNKPADKPGAKPAVSQPTGDAHVSNVGEVKIIADKANNSIVIVATPREYETILPVIQELDILPLQVLIDATVASITLTDNLKYGIEWFLRQGNTAIGGNLGGQGGSSGIDLGNLAITGAQTFGTGGLSLVQNSGSVKAILHAEANKGNVDVISSPSLMVLNNQQAKINVGDEVPIQTSSTTIPLAGAATTGSLATGNTISYKDTGVTLEVTPRVNANGMVILNLHQIVSAVVPTTTGVTTSATINKQEIESSVAVLDGETITLGGLIKDNNAENKSGIPFLYELPLIGPLFGNTTYTKTKNELVVLITPRVVKSKQNSRLVTNEFKRKLTGIYQDVSQGDYGAGMGRDEKLIH
ncbi:MAG: type II secretion system secretin GspD [Methylococcales bacterium]|nr:type II secretion system secretin GspD [Methylococcales bacterium]